DFDVLIGVRRGRIFTNRFFAVLVLGLAGYFKHNMHEQEKAKDMICPNHFVAPGAYRLTPPYIDYDQAIYAGLVPVMGNETKIEQFFRANDWMKPRRVYKKDQRYLGEANSLFKRAVEWLLGGWLGDLAERLKFVQISEISRGLPPKMPAGARFVCNENELRFHLNSAQTITKWRERKQKKTFKTASFHY
ncbi:MAG: hypothetical protein PHV43_00715, partial [Candidatus Colwellbacteria bacterium]|nr:hypothetical protein [Candidatus Colwellbacteria bacterium]